MSEQEEKVEAVKKALGAPIICEFNANTHRIRTTLFLLSAVAIGYTLGGLKVDPGSSILGLRFDGLNDDFFRLVLFGIIAYLTLHFIWCAQDGFLEWRLRITGSRVAFVTTGMFASDHLDYPGDPRQSTLYNWWIEQSGSLAGLDEKFAQVETAFEAMNAELGKIREEKPDLAVGKDAQTLNLIRNEITSLKQTLGQVHKVLGSDRIPASLERFDGWFKIFLKSQNIRWLLVEFALPVGLAGTALYLLSNNTEVAQSAMGL